MLFYDQIRQLRKSGTEVSVTVDAGKAPADSPDPLDGASCQPAGGPGTPVNAVPASGTTVLPTVPHAIVHAHPECSPIALVNYGRLPINVSGDAATLLPHTTLPGTSDTVTDIEPNMEPVVPPAVNAAAVGAIVDDAQPQLVEPNMEPVVPPAVNIAAVGAIVHDVQPQLASSRSALSSPAEQQVADNLHVGKRKRWVLVTLYR